MELIRSICVKETMFRFRIISLLIVTTFAAAGIAVYSYYAGLPVLPPSKFPEIDGIFARAEYIDIGNQDQLFFRYGGISDSGVELERVVNGQIAWRVYAPALGVGHSKYRHDATIRVEKTGSHSQQHRFAGFVR